MSRTPSPRPLKKPKAMQNCPGSVVSGFSAGCLFFFSRRLTLLRFWGDSGSGSFPVHLAGWRRPKGCRVPASAPRRSPGAAGPGGAGLRGGSPSAPGSVRARTGSYRLQREDGGVRVLWELSVSLWLGLPLYNGIKFKFKCGRDV